MIGHKTKVMYKFGTTGKLLEWSCHTDGAKVVTITGEEGGKLQEHVYTAEAKNIGRANETTPEEQAQVELDAHYTSQETNAHYRYSEEEANVFFENNNIPRKIHNYKDHASKLPDTCYTSTKANGRRACVVGGKLYSKIGRVEEIKVKHLREAVEKVALSSCPDFDAEVYAHGLSLQRISSAWLKPIKANKEIISMANKRLKSRKVGTKCVDLNDAIEILGYNPNEDALKLKFYVFDMPVEDVSVKHRIHMMKTFEYSVVKTLGLGDVFEFLYPVETHSVQERLALRNSVVADGWEGLVHAAPDDLYTFNTKVYTTLKDKPRYDAEALVVGVEKCKNGDGKLLLEAADVLDNVSFKCMMKVNRRDGNTYGRSYEEMQKLVGNWVTFSYEELSGAGVPTKPVGEGVRKCNSKGEPLE